MKIIFKNITAISLAFLVLFSTMSFVISEHYCGGELVASAIFTKAEVCGMEMQNASSTNKNGLEKDSCCKDVEKLVEGQDDLKLDFTNLNQHQQVFIASFIYSYINLFESVDKENIHFKDYSPPFIVKDIQVLDESFLI